MRDSIAIIGWTMLLAGLLQLVVGEVEDAEMARQAETWTFKPAFVLGM